jgi:hypothetical protein
MVPKEEFKNFLEKIARGSMSDQPTAVSDVFSTEMMNLLSLENCISSNNPK